MLDSENTAQPEIEVVQKVKINPYVKPPKLYSIIFNNDDITPGEFVITTLIEIFGFSIEAANALMIEINNVGLGVAASDITLELASHLKSLVDARALYEKFPLVLEIKENG